MTITILRSAIEDLARGHEFYERQAEGLGYYFSDSLAADVESLLIYAGIHSKDHGYHRLLARRFPYAVYYDVRDNQAIRIHAVLDCRQNPEWTESRLNQ